MDIKIKKLKDELFDSDNYITSLEKELSTTNQLNKIYIHELSNKNKKLEINSKDIQNTLIKYEGQNIVLNSEYTILKDENKELLNKIKQLEIKLEIKKNDVTSIYKSYNELFETNKQINDLNIDLKSKLNELETDNLKLENNLNFISSTINKEGGLSLEDELSFENNINDIQKKNNYLYNQIYELNKENDKLKLMLLQTKKCCCNVM